MDALIKLNPYAATFKRLRTLASTKTAAPAKAAKAPAAKAPAAKAPAAAKKGGK